MQKGYEILEVHEIYEYQVTQYDPQTGNGGLSAEYINTFLKLKAEASGYTNWVQCPEDKDRFISNFNKSEGIELDKGAIRPNPAKRGLTKLCQNPCGVS